MENDGVNEERIGFDADFVGLIRQPIGVGLELKGAIADPLPLSGEFGFESHSIG